MSTNRGLVLHKIDDLQIEDLPCPCLKDDQVLLEMEIVGICGSDVHYWVDGRIGDFIVEKPMIMGHEASGTVIKCGKNVTNLRCGDRVAIEPGVPCRKCDQCKKGMYNLCPEIEFCATPPVDGNLRYYYAHAADFCHILPDCMDFEDGALLEPLTCAVHACRRGRVKVGSSVCIFGAGPIGLCCLMVARALGAKLIIISDTKSYRLEKAKCLGADMVLEVQPNTPLDCYATQILKNLGEADCCLEASGAEIAAQVAVKVAGPGAAVVLIGISDKPINISLLNVAVKQADVMGIFRYNNDYQTALELVRSGLVCPKEIVTHRFGFEDSIKAFETAKSGCGDPIKILINIKDRNNKSGCKCPSKPK